MRLIFSPVMRAPSTRHAWLHPPYHDTVPRPSKRRSSPIRSVHPRFRPPKHLPPSPTACPHGGFMPTHLVKVFSTDHHFRRPRFPRTFLPLQFALNSATHRRFVFARTTRWLTAIFMTVLARTVALIRPPAARRISAPKLSRASAKGEMCAPHARVGAPLDLRRYRRPRRLPSRPP